MTIIRNTNDAYGMPTCHYGDTLEEAVAELQAGLRSCGPEMADVVVTADDYEECVDPPLGYAWDDEDSAPVAWCDECHTFRNVSHIDQLGSDGPVHAAVKCNCPDNDELVPITRITN